MHGRVERPGHVLGQPVGVLDLGHPLGHAQGARPEHLAVVQLLEGLAVALVAGHLADEQDHRRGVLEGRVQADAGVGRPRAAGDEAHPGATAELALRLGHEGGPALLPASHEADALAVLVKPVEDGQIALPGHAEDRVHALLDQALHQRMAGQSGVEILAHRFVPSTVGVRREAQATIWAEAMAMANAAAATANTACGRPASIRAPNTGAVTAKPTSRPEYTVP